MRHQQLEQQLLRVIADAVSTFRPLRKIQRRHPRLVRAQAERAEHYVFRRWRLAAHQLDRHLEPAHEPRRRSSLILVRRQGVHREVSRRQLLNQPSQSQPHHQPRLRSQPCAKCRSRCAPLPQSSLKCRRAIEVQQGL